MDNDNNNEPEEFLEMFLSYTFNLLGTTNARYVGNSSISASNYADSTDSVYEYLGDVNGQLECFSEACLAEHMKWETNMSERIELVFGKGRSQLLHCQPSDLKQGRKLSKSSFRLLSVDIDIKASYLIRLLAVSLQEYGYDARLCYMLDQLWSVLGLSKDQYVQKVEEQIAQQIKGSSLHEQQDLQAQKPKGQNPNLTKGILVGLGAVLGGVAVGVTAGLAAPALIPIFGTLFGASAGLAFLSGSTGVALFGIVFGAGGAGLAGYRVNRRYKSIRSFHFHPLVKEDQMRVAIGISGWLIEDEDLFRPWFGLAQRGVDLYVLECDKKVFKELGSAIGELIASSAVSYAALQILKTTALSTAVAALTWPVALLQAASFIDNPWSVAMNVAKKAGLIMADAIKKRAHGHRPLTLTGFSLGALIITACLEELSKDPAMHLGIIENVVLFGLPVEIMPLERWSKMRMLIAGRFVHCYSKNDWVLRFLYRTTSLTVGDIAGLNPIEHVDGLENVNMSNFVNGHTEYVEKIPEMLKLFFF